MARIACLLVKDFPLAAIVRANPELRGTPFALSCGPGPRAELSWISSLARRFGVTAGMTVAQAAAIVPELVVINHNAGAEHAAADALIDVAQSFSPIVEQEKPGTVYIDLTGTATLFGTEQELAKEAARRVRHIGMEAEIGTAANKEIAGLAAKCGGIRIIAPGLESEFLNWLPLQLLQLDEELEMTLARWGIRRLGELARLDAKEVGSRLGLNGVGLVRIARGELARPMVARPQAEQFAEKIELEYGIELLEALRFVMRGLLERLIARLELRGLIVSDMTLALELADHRRDQRRIAVSAPTNEVRPLLTLLCLSLEKTPPPGPVEAVQISAEPRSPRPAQGDMFLPPTPAPERLQATLARLAALCGPDHVGVLRTQNSHRPEAVELEIFAPDKSPLSCSPPASPNFSRIVLRAVRPPEEIEVMCDRGRPEFIRGSTVCARVVSIAGPWRRQGEWWSEHSDGFALEIKSAKGIDQREHINQRHGISFARDYYDLALDDGGVYRVFCDLSKQQRWFIDGVYD